MPAVEPDARMWKREQQQVACWMAWAEGLDVRGCAEAASAGGEPVDEGTARRWIRMLGVPLPPTDERGRREEAERRQLCALLGVSEWELDERDAQLSRAVELVHGGLTAKEAARRVTSMGMPVRADVVRTKVKREEMRR